MCAPDSALVLTFMSNMQNYPGFWFKAAGFTLGKVSDHSPAVVSNQLFKQVTLKAKSSENLLQSKLNHLKPHPKSVYNQI